MGREFPREQYLQFLVAPILGLSVDLSMHLFSFVHTNSYIAQIAVLLIGSAIVAASILMQLEANVVNNSGEGLVKAISIKVKKDFSSVKLCFDVSLVLIAISISLLAMGEFNGIREGTIVPPSLSDR